MKRFLIVLLTLGLAGCAATSAPSSTDNVTDGQTSDPMVTTTPTVTETSVEPTDDQTTDSVIIYFSNTGNTESVATTLSGLIDADIIRIEPTVPYASEDLDYNNGQSRVNLEQNDESARPEIANEIDIDGYTTIYLGFPIWWGTTPRIIQTFLESYDFTGKTIAPFCTSGSSGISSAMTVIETEASGATILDGIRIDVNDAESELSAWLGQIGMK